MNNRKRNLIKIVNFLKLIIRITLTSHESRLRGNDSFCTSVCFCVWRFTISCSFYDFGRKWNRPRSNFGINWTLFWVKLIQVPTKNISRLLETLINSRRDSLTTQKKSSVISNFFWGLYFTLSYCLSFKNIMMKCDIKKEINWLVF